MMYDDAHYIKLRPEVFAPFIFKPNVPFLGKIFNINIFREK